MLQKFYLGKILLHKHSAMPESSLRIIHM